MWTTNTLFLLVTLGAGVACLLFNDHFAREMAAQQSAFFGGQFKPRRTIWIIVGLFLIFIGVFTALYPKS